MQMDLIRQQLEFEAQHIRSLMEERFGTSDEMVQRAQVRRWAGPGAEQVRGSGHYPAGGDCCGRGLAQGAEPELESFVGGARGG